MSDEQNIEGTYPISVKHTATELAALFSAGTHRKMQTTATHDIILDAQEVDPLIQQEDILLLGYALAAEVLQIRGVQEEALTAGLSKGVAALASKMDWNMDKPEIAYMSASFFQIAILWAHSRIQENPSAVVDPVARLQQLEQYFSQMITTLSDFAQKYLIAPSGYDMPTYLGVLRKLFFVSATNANTKILYRELARGNISAVITELAKPSNVTRTREIMAKLFPS